MKWAISIGTGIIGLLYFASLFAFTSPDSNSNLVVTTLVVNSQRVTQFVAQNTYLYFATIIGASLTLIALTHYVCLSVSRDFDHTVKRIDSTNKQSYGNHVIRSE